MNKPKKERSRKLTKDLMYQMRNNALALKFAKEEKAFHKENVQLGELVYGLRYNPYKKAIDALPEGALATQDWITMQLDSGSIRLCFNKPRLIFYADVYNVVKVKLTPSVKKRIEKLKVKKNTLYRNRQSYGEKVWQILNRVTTTKQLFEVMPEAKAWMPNAGPCTDIAVADLVVELGKL